MCAPPFIARPYVGTGLSTEIRSHDVKILFRQRFFQLFTYGAQFTIMTQLLSSIFMESPVTRLSTITGQQDAVRDDCVQFGYQSLDQGPFTTIAFSSGSSTLQLMQLNTLSRPSTHNTLLNIVYLALFAL